MHETKDTQGTASAEKVPASGLIYGPLQEELTYSPFWKYETEVQPALGDPTIPLASIPQVKLSPEAILPVSTASKPPQKRHHRPWNKRGKILLFILIAEVAIATGLTAYLLAPNFFFRPTVHSRTLFQATSSSHVLVPTPTKILPTLTPTLTVLAQDDFRRPNQQFWGTASDGSLWIGDANSSPFFSIQADAGQIEGGKGFLNALLGIQRTDEEIVVTAGVNQFDQTNINLGAVLRWSDPNDYYKAYVDGTNLILLKKVRGIITRLAALPFPLQRGASFTLRFRIIGSQIQVAAWRIGMPEPTHWQLAIFDHSLVSGFGGLRVLVEPGTQMRVFSFQELTV